MKHYSCWGDLLKELDNLHDCEIYINKNFEEYLTRLSRGRQNELKSLLKLKKITIKVIKQPRDKWKKGWSWFKMKDEVEDEKY